MPRPSDDPTPTTATTPGAPKREARRTRLQWGRRLLLVPAAALVLIGGSAIALDQPASSNPTPTQQQVPVAPANQAVGAGYQSEVPVNSAEVLGVNWKGDPGAQFTVEARQANGQWTTVKNVGAADTGADPGSPDARKVAANGQDATDPVSVEGASEVRVVVQKGTVSDVSLTAINSNPGSAPSGSAGALDGVLPRIDGPARYAYAIAIVAVVALLVALAFGWSPRRVSRKTLRRLFLALVAGGLLAGCVLPAPANLPDGRTQPPIISRAQWGAIPYDTTNCGPPEYADHLNFAVVHHTDTPNTDSAADSAARVRSIQLYHMGTLHYCDIAYNFLIDRYGQIFEGRDGGIDKPVIAAHAGGFNTSSVGVALLGTFTSVQPTQAQYNALVSLLRWRLSIARVDPRIGYIATAGSFAGARVPAGTQVYLPNGIIGHRDVDLTDCPGDKMYALLPQLRNDVEKGLSFPPTTTAATSTTTTTTIAPGTTTTTM
jgi:hypothetical protein